MANRCVRGIADPPEQVEPLARLPEDARAVQAIGWRELRVLAMRLSEDIGPGDPAPILIDGSTTDTELARTSSSPPSPREPLRGWGLLRSQVGVTRGGLNGPLGQAPGLCGEKVELVSHQLAEHDKHSVHLDQHVDTGEAFEPRKLGIDVGADVLQPVVSHGRCWRYWITTTVVPPSSSIRERSAPAPPDSSLEDRRS